MNRNRPRTCNGTRQPRSQNLNLNFRLQLKLPPTVGEFSKNVARFSEPIAGERSRLGEPND